MCEERICSAEVESYVAHEAGEPLCRRHISELGLTCVFCEPLLIRRDWFRQYARSHVGWVLHRT